ncbi:hypothetical protein HNQ35_000274 [Cerasibacillus quisquiliarum]|uniref:DUF4430 domain-containing protein n=1 Tax=Cerasibacillus quisquiliarum TaxID=227865 RepID=A0A511UTU8_9BACI|nr:DUF4430 domain-containing protein [Cerasibacillus quisquiliarum]MBB5145085.1 hypothetical protein [Cerasibacillus quisquiliarum]GEN30025.1 hypothetical protein CQU01_02630 [Cerasibacillus quisquiliarum]
MRKSYAIIFTFFLIISQFSFLRPYFVIAETYDEVVMISAVDESGKVIVPVTAVPMSKGDTAFDIWLAGAQEHHFDIRYEDTEQGAFIQEVAHIKATDKYFWSFVINGKESDTGLSAYDVKHGDHLMLVLRDLDNFAPSVHVHVSVTDESGKSIVPMTDITVSKDATVYDVIYQLSLETEKPFVVRMDDGYMSYILDTYFISAIMIHDDVIEEKEMTYQVSDEDVLQIEIEAALEQQDDQSVQVNAKQRKETHDAKTEINEAHVSQDVLKQKELLKKVPPFSKSLLQQQIKQTLSFFKRQGELQYGDEWLIWGLAHADEHISNTYLDSMKELLEDHYVIEDIFELEKIIISLSALGEDAANFNGHRLINQLIRHEEFEKASPSINSVIYGLIALDSRAYDANDDIRKHLVDILLQNQLSDGGWAWTGDVSTADITAMVLQALAPYQDEQDVKLAIDDALKFLQEELQEIGGYYDEWSGYPSETTSQVIIALTALGIDPTSDTYTTAGGHLLEHLFKYRANDGAFKHVIHEESNVLATEQAFLALLAYERYQSGKGSVFDFTSMKKSNFQADEESQTGKKLSNTNMSNYLLIGIVIVLLVGILLFRRIKRNT